VLLWVVGVVGAGVSSAAIWVRRNPVVAGGEGTGGYGVVLDEPSVMMVGAGRQRAEASRLGMRRARWSVVSAAQRAGWCDRCMTVLITDLEMDSPVLAVVVSGLRPGRGGVPGGGMVFVGVSTLSGAL